MVGEVNANPGSSVVLPDIFNRILPIPVEIIFCSGKRAARGLKDETPTRYCILRRSLANIVVVSRPGVTL